MARSAVRCQPSDTSHLLDRRSSPGAPGSQPAVHASAAKEIAKQAAKELKHDKGVYAHYGKTLGKLYRDHGAGAAEMQAVIDDLNGKWHGAQKKILDAHFAIRASLTEEEWLAQTSEMPKCCA